MKIDVTITTDACSQCWLSGCDIFTKPHPSVRPSCKTCRSNTHFASASSSLQSTPLLCRVLQWYTEHDVAESKHVSGTHSLLRSDPRQFSNSFGSCNLWRLTPVRERIPTAITKTLGLGQNPSSWGGVCVDFSHFTEQAQSWGVLFKQRMSPPTSRIQ